MTRTLPLCIRLTPFVHRPNNDDAETESHSLAKLSAHSPLLWKITLYHTTIHNIKEYYHEVLSSHATTNLIVIIGDNDSGTLKAYC